MIAFDADVLSELFRGSADYVQRAEAIPGDQHAIPVVVMEEIATLISRNRRDFELVPGLSVEFWE